MNSARLARLTVGSVILVMLATGVGCVSLQKAYPVKQEYVLDCSRSGPRRQALPESSLKVRRFRVAPTFESKGFVYQKTDLSYHSDFYNRFFSPPASLVTEEVRQWISDSGLFESVVDPGMGIIPTHSLEGVINALYGDFREPDAPKAVLEMQFFLVREATAARDITFNRKYRQTVALDDPSPTTLVSGWNKALQSILTGVETDLEVDLKKLR